MLLCVWVIFYVYGGTSAVGSVAAFYNGPVDNVPKRVERVGTPVLIVEVIGMFPDVEGQNRGESFGYGVARVALLRYEQFSVVVAAEPYPARAKQFDARVDEFLFEILERSEIAVDGLAQFSFSPPPSGENEKK